MGGTEFLLHVDHSASPVCLNVPGFAEENDIPIGLTVVAPRYTDLYLLHIEKAIGNFSSQKEASSRN